MATAKKNGSERNRQQTDTEEETKTTGKFLGLFSAVHENSRNETEYSFGSLCTAEDSPRNFLLYKQFGI